MRLSSAAPALRRHHPSSTFLAQPGHSKIAAVITQTDRPRGEASTSRLQMKDAHRSKCPDQPEKIRTPRARIASAIARASYNRYRRKSSPQPCIHSQIRWINLQVPSPKVSRRRPPSTGHRQRRNKTASPPLRIDAVHGHRRPPLATGEDIAPEETARS